MSDKLTIGQRLLTLKQRSGLSLAQIATAAGYAGASSIQKLFSPQYDPGVLHEGVAQKLSIALVGRGDPRIEKSEVFALAGQGGELDRIVADLQHYAYISSAYIGMHRTKRISDEVVSDAGVPTPLFANAEMVDGISYYPCPEHLRPRLLVGMYVTVGNMWPRYEEGEPVIYERKTPPSRGDDVVVRLISEVELDGGMLIGRLALLHDEEIQLDQLSPKGRITISRGDVIAVYRILHATDFLPPLMYASAVD